MDPAAILERVLGDRRVARIMAVLDTFGKAPGGLLAKVGKLKEQFGKLGFVNALIIDGATVDEQFARAARNVPHIDVLPIQGINVYDIMRRQKLVLTKAALDALEARFK